MTISNNLPGTISPTGWQFPDNLSLEEWLACGQALDHGKDAPTQWLRGDWWVAGVNRKYGDGQELAHQAGVDYGTVQVYGSVARAFQILTRVKNLTFDHHRAALAARVKGDKPATLALRIEWLQRALDNKWSAARLRDEIKASQPVEPKAEVVEDDKPKHEPVPEYRLFDFTRHSRVYAEQVRAYYTQFPHGEIGAWDNPHTNGEPALMQWGGAMPWDAACDKLTGESGPGKILGYANALEVVIQIRPRRVAVTKTAGGFEVAVVKQETHNDARPTDGAPNRSLRRRRAPASAGVLRNPGRTRRQDHA